MNLASVCFTQLWLKKSNPQISLYTVPFISFCTTCLLSTGKQKGENFKEQPTWHLQHWAITQFETLPKHQASCFASGDGGKTKGAGGEQGEEWDGRNREEEKGSGELWGWARAGPWEDGCSHPRASSAWSVLGAGESGVLERECTRKIFLMLM